MKVRVLQSSLAVKAVNAYITVKLIPTQCHMLANWRFFFFFSEQM